MADEPQQEPTPTPPARGVEISSSPPEIPGAHSSPEGKKQSDVSKLSPEEQMALFEKELKENDWGHQPC